MAFAFTFPSILSQTAFGFSKTIGRTATIMAPMAAELDLPKPMIIFSILAIIGVIASFFLKIKEPTDKKKTNTVTRHSSA